VPGGSAHPRRSAGLGRAREGAPDRPEAAARRARARRLAARASGRRGGHAQLDRFLAGGARGAPAGRAGPDRAHAPPVDAGAARAARALALHARRGARRHHRRGDPAAADRAQRLSARAHRLGADRRRSRALPARRARRDARAPRPARGPDPRRHRGDAAQLEGARRPAAGDDAPAGEHRAAHRRRRAAARRARGGDRAARPRGPRAHAGQPGRRTPTKACRRRWCRRCCASCRA